VISKYLGSTYGTQLCEVMEVGMYVYARPVLIHGDIIAQILSLIHMISES